MPQFDISIIPSQSLSIFIFFFFYFIYLKYGLIMFSFTRKITHYVEISFKRRFIIGLTRIGMVGNERRKNRSFLRRELSVLNIFNKFYTSSKRIVPSKVYIYASPIRLYHTSQFKHASVKNIYPTKSKIKEENIVETMAKPFGKSLEERKKLANLILNIKFKILLNKVQPLFSKNKKKKVRNLLPTDLRAAVASPNFHINFIPLISSDCSNNTPSNIDLKNVDLSNEQEVLDYIKRNAFLLK